PDPRDVAGPLEAGARLREHLPHDALVGRQQVGWDETAFEQKRERLLAERAQVERGPVLERPQRADRMDARDEAAHPFERVALIELRCASALARRDREQKTAT